MTNERTEVVMGEETRAEGVSVPPGEGTTQEEFYREASGATDVRRLLVPPASPDGLLRDAARALEGGDLAGGLAALEHAIEMRQAQGASSFELAPADAAALYRWAIGDGSRATPRNPAELHAAGRGLRCLVEQAGDELAWEPVEGAEGVSMLVATYELPVPTLSDPDERQLGPFVRDSDTSRRAALEAYPRQGTQRWKILDALWLRYRNGRHGATRDELASELRMSPNAVRPRVVELGRGGWIGGAGETDSADALHADETRLTASRRDAEVLVLTTAGIERMEAR